MLTKKIFFLIILLATLAINNITAYAQQNNKPGTALPASPTGYLPTGYLPASKLNYIRVWDALSPISDPTSFVTVDYKYVTQSTEYLDGLGRTIQIVSKQSTPGASPKDIVAPLVYDNLGREIYKYLPYASIENNGEFKLDPYNAQKTFMQAQFSEEHVYYSQNNYEASPLNRVVKILPVGDTWAGSNRGISKEQKFNMGNEVRIWNISSDPLTYNFNIDQEVNIPISLTAFDNNSVYKNVTLNEAGNAIVEYTDKEGRMLLKKIQEGDIQSDYSGHDGFLCTYYVYDDLDRLRFVIPPKAVQAIKASWQLNNDVINELCFRYEYDGRNRMIAKKVPGADWVYLVYDSRDRQVFMQDANMRQKNQWLTTLYDKLNRAVISGMMTWNAGTPADLQGIANERSSDIPLPGLINDRELPESGQTQPVDGLFQAYNSITLNHGFESGSNFIAEIVDLSSIEETLIEGLYIHKNPLPEGSVFIALTKKYFDSYDWTNITYNSSFNSLLTAETNTTLGYNLHPETMPSKATIKYAGLLTGSSVRIIQNPEDLTSGTWLTTVNFYDDKGRIIQVNSENYLGGKDIITTRYNFTDAVICSYLDHTNPHGTPASLHIRTNILIDHGGRIIEVYKTINDDESKKALIAKYEYNELGQLKNKELGRKKDANGYTSEPVGEFSFEYNIRGWLTGINKLYANGNEQPNNNAPWFGMEINYDKGFQINQYNGNIAGVKWRSKGDDQKRAFGYSYDKMNRLLGADFSQHDGGSYTDNNIVNFDMAMGDGVNSGSAYDENGNIQSMKQWGMHLNSSSLIDDLKYTYFSNSNKLQLVQDIATAGSPALGSNSSLGDFADRNTGDDYGYDLNGNMITDKNKRLNGTTGQSLSSGGAIKYNFLNLPWQIPIMTEQGSEKGTISYTYDATGAKLQKKCVENNITLKHNGTDYITSVTTISDYTDGLYESKSYSNPALSSLAYTKKLLFVRHEEGRSRFIAEVGSTPAHYEHDYFVKDHLSNVRMVLTEELKTDIYQATIEQPNRSFEIELFGQKVESTSIDKPTGFDTDNSNEKTSRLNSNTPDGRVGPGVILKVMAGDKINARTFAWYQPNGMDYSSDPALPAIVQNLLGQLIMGITGVGKGTAAQQITHEILQPGMQQFLNGQAPLTDAPKAYLNWLLFDEEQFKEVISGFVPVPKIFPDQQKILLQTNNGNDIVMPKNGYLYVYVSSESKGNVYFDDLRIEHERSPMIEETHYYPFGLAMAGISSKAMGKLENNYKFNGGAELNNFLELGLYETDYRFYDPQIGMFRQIDPLADVSRSWSPYVFSSDNPINRNDPQGLKDTIINGQRMQRDKDLEPVYVFAKAPKKLPSKEDQASPSGPYAEIIDVLVDKNTSKNERLSKLWKMRHDRAFQRKLDGQTLKNILSGWMLKAFKAGFTVVDLYSFGSDVQGGNFPPLPLLGVAIQMIGNDYYSNYDSELFDVAAKQGYKHLARLLSSSYGNRSGLVGMYVTKETMQAVLANGALNMELHKAYRPAVDGVYPDNPLNDDGKPFDFMIIFPKNTRGAVTNFGIMPIK